MRNAISKLYTLLKRPAPVSNHDPKAVLAHRYRQMEQTRLNSFDI